jgi:prepilin-type N-terminal cleavage/methylation domain-containing protein
VARRLNQRRRQGGDESGFTLIELIVVIAVVPVILGGIATALIALFTLQQSVNNRVGASNDVLVASTNFNRDVQSAALMTTQPTPAACGTVGTGQFQLLALEWGPNPVAVAQGGPPGGYNTVVSYISTKVVNAQNNTTTYSLTRDVCTFGTSTAPSSSVTVAHDIGITPTITIYGPKNAQGNFTDITREFAPGTCTGTTCPWNATLGVTKVEFDVQGSQTQSNFSYALVGLPGLSKSQSSPSALTSRSSPPGCGFATPGSGTYANQLCFADFSGYSFSKASGNNCIPPGQTTSQPGQLFLLPIAETPYTLSFCLQVSANDVTPFIIPTYYNPSGDDSEAFLGNNGFYTGISYNGTPENSALYENVNGSFVTATFTNVQVLDSAGHAASGWTLVTGDAESTDTNEWMEFSNTSGINWYDLPNSGPSDLWGNACYDDKDPNNSGALAWTGPVPPTASGAGSVGSPSTGPPSTSTALTVNSSTYATGVTSILCESDQQLNKTGTMMLQSQEAQNPAGSTAAQSVSVTMKGAGLEGLFFGVLL